MKIRCLTIHSEWAPAFTHMGKPVENRVWPPPNALTGQRFALHAGVSWPGPKSARWQSFQKAAKDAGWIVSNSGKGKMVITQPNVRGFDVVTVPLGHIFATARLELVTRFDSGEVLQCASSASLDTAPDRKSPWAFGPYCWWLEDLVVLDEPIEARGGLGLWSAEVPAEDG